jgi:hypothetical protein
MKKTPLEKLVINTLNSPFYLNVAQPFDWPPCNWKRPQPCWDIKYAGATNRLEAIKLRKKWLLDLKKMNIDWKEKDLKTVKIEYCKIYK